MGWFSWFSSENPQSGRDELYRAKDFLEQQLRAAQQAGEDEEFSDKGLNSSEEVLDVHRSDIQVFLEAIGERSSRTYNSLAQQLQVVHNQFEDDRIADMKASLEDIIDEIDTWLDQPINE